MDLYADRCAIGEDIRFVNPYTNRVDNRKREQTTTHTPRKCFQHVNMPQIDLRQYCIAEMAIVQYARHIITLRQHGRSFNLNRHGHYQRLFSQQLVLENTNARHYMKLVKMDTAH